MILLHIYNNNIEILDPEREFEEYIESVITEMEGDVIEIDKSELEDYLEQGCLCLARIELENENNLYRIESYTKGVVGAECYVLKDNGEKYTLYTDKYSKNTTSKSFRVMVTYYNDDGTIEKIVNFMSMDELREEGFKKFEEGEEIDKNKL